ncbi:MAG: hypothetical protein HC875_24770 [Anaerolineales bacterium]|nr:hypothetical protein [Anaerolineales bacterium]
MSSELLEWVCAYLDRDEEIVVPIKRMWNEWHALHSEPSLEDFSALLLADDRFEEMEGVDHTEGLEWDSPEELDEYVREMEAVGFFSGPRLKLKARELTLEHITHMIKLHNDRMEAALHQARALMPDDVSEEEEGQLIDIIVLAQELRRQLRETGLDPDDRDEA